MSRLCWCQMIPALLLSLALVQPAPAVAETDIPLRDDVIRDAGLEPEAPSVVHIPGRGYWFNDEAYKRVNDELTRLQAVEAEHKAESWVNVVLVSAGVGLAVGAVSAGLIVNALKK